MATRSATRKRQATEEINVGKVFKHNKLCDSIHDDFLGFCNLDEIDYYEALKLEFNPNQVVDEQFVLDVIRLTNVVTKQVRKYRNLNEQHHNNYVYNVLIMINHARSVLTDQSKKERYDKIVVEKNTNVMKLCDNYIMQLKQVGQELTEAKQKFVQELKSFNLPQFRKMLNESLDERLQKWLSSQMVTIERPTTMNRVLVKWVLFEEEVNYNKQQVEQMLRNYFEQFGNIVNVYVCDLETGRAIVEFATLIAQRKAIEQSRLPNVRFTVTEYMLTEFYNSQMRAKLRDKMNSIGSQLNDLQQQLADAQAQLNRS
ncbi:hypothetical protein [Epiphyas postvittana nucleopolyhedrovirus]|uniref:RRM domain-containing protein n=1 Tax=Epiphyas postvittana nucleopolyhedrovirus TaxID=70600 RepID=Q91GK5_NPVEP|nr:hypothetical protein [Epiphyas postvittana nucleopolyhedrovirus]AAK85610.1 unknown [Epiphyas postvittana nucleopolyhedrovirus]